MPDSAYREQSETIGLRFEDLPFSSVPNQSKLFLDYLRDPNALKKYYPSAVANSVDLVSHVDEVLSNYLVDRNEICDVLEEQNRGFDGSERTLQNIEMLRSSDCVAVLTGQQVGLFTGPLYTIYKALSAIVFAERLNKSGVKAVPVFWMATEDHDFEEVSKAVGVSKDNGLVSAEFKAVDSDTAKPVGSIRFDETIQGLISEWFSVLPKTEFSEDLRNDLVAMYTAEATFGSGFGRLLAELFGKYGLIVFDPLHEKAKGLAAPIFEKAIELSDAIVDALRVRSEDLKSNGYHAQVLVEENYFPFFWVDDEGKRVAIKRIGEGKYRIVGSRDELTSVQLINAAREQPTRLSPGVMLRPVVQDHLFPTVCYIGGSAEIAYFAQNSVVYDILNRPSTPIFHRQSFTIVEPKHARTLEKYNLSFRDLFGGFDSILPDVIQRVIDPATPLVFTQVEEKINTELNRLDQQLSGIDPTLAASLAKRRQKIIYHVAALRTKFERARIEKDEIANRRLRSLFTELYPQAALQERTINFFSFANLHDTQMIDWLYDSADIDNKCHRLIYL
ncbi:MAG: bacillithiol biosynthesis cysteine-adding enzyme BshC [Acidobacteria bacterium]|nr:MAG: bacillithiol biosynthesis cysteine-adding enzyme BshC [Acidobacteriota bacterium]